MRAVMVRGAGRHFSSGGHRDVNNEANNLNGQMGSLVAALGATWYDIGSTDGTSALTNLVLNCISSG